MRENDYDAFAEAYDAGNEDNAWNAYYERPASVSLAGNVSGLRVLDAGCGGGRHAQALVGKDAVLTGIDSSQGMLSIARRRLGTRAKLLHANLNEPLPFANDEFDLVLAALVLHYLEDWSATLREFHRVLGNAGRLVISTHHPFMDHPQAGHSNYFETYAYEEQWEQGGKSVTMRFWHRPLHAMTDAIARAGFLLETLSEPAPDPKARTLFPDAFESLSTQPRFIFFSARKA
jgi:ubiquinone/menaquinone biosynthesis C-methylase UbiE